MYQDLFCLKKRSWGSTFAAAAYQRFKKILDDNVGKAVFYDICICSGVIAWGKRLKET